LYVAQNYDTARAIYERVKISKERFMSSNQFLYEVDGKKTRNIILDEYMLFDNKDEVYKKIQYVRPENVYIFSSFYKSYSRKIFDFIKDNKQVMSYQGMLDSYDGELTDNIRQQFYDLYYNFITDYDVKLVDFDFNDGVRYSDMQIIFLNE